MLKPEKSGQHLVDNIFKGIFMKDNLSILIEISLKSLSDGPNDRKASLVEVMVGTKQLSSHILNQ